MKLVTRASRCNNAMLDRQFMSFKSVSAGELAFLGWIRAPRNIAPPRFPMLVTVLSVTGVSLNQQLGVISISIRKRRISIKDHKFPLLINTALVAAMSQGTIVRAFASLFKSVHVDFAELFIFVIP
jgi:hypothetical protein